MLGVIAAFIGNMWVCVSVVPAHGGKTQNPFSGSVVIWGQSLGPSSISRSLEHFNDLLSSLPCISSPILPPFLPLPFSSFSLHDIPWPQAPCPPFPLVLSSFFWTEFVHNVIYVEASELLSLSLTYPSFFGLVFNLNLCQFSPWYFRLHQMSVVTCLIKWYYGEIFLSDTRYCSNHYRKRIKSIKHIL